ncbi:hypothetical protein [Bauldia sp.]|uniref:hypothetical protein n=1 Tax=Bauldia sp. TaxID=2575872 RepID=UPI003BACA8C8
MAVINTPTLSLSFWPIRLVFAVEALAFGTLLPRIPDLKTALQLSEADLGLALLGIPVGTLLGFTIAPIVVRALGLRLAVAVSIVALALAAILPALAWSREALFAALLCGGVAMTHSEIALNSKTGSIEAAAGRRIMSQCHGFWSLGMIAGVLLGGSLAQQGITVLHQSVAIAVFVVPAAVLIVSRLPLDPPPAPPCGSGFALPPLALLPLCLLPVGIMIIEGIFMDWSAVFLREIVGADPFAASLGFAAVAAAMAVVRLVGDRLAARFGDLAVVIVSAIAAGGGMLGFACADTVLMAIGAAALAGAGVATVYPIALSAAARMPGRPERNIAAVSFTSFLILLGSPAAFGFAAEAYGFRAALAACAALALPTLFLAPALRARRRLASS